MLAMKNANRELKLAGEFVRDTGCNLFLTGKAGTGKTTFLRS
jgi:tRNA A37 threonylcarbamoyladenosine biosynthesis protein TsaE